MIKYEFQPLNDSKYDCFSCISNEFQNQNAVDGGRGASGRAVVQHVVEALEIGIVFATHHLRDMVPCFVR